MQLSKGCTKLDVKREEEKREKKYFISHLSYRDRIRGIIHITATILRKCSMNSRVRGTDVECGTAHLLDGS